MELIVLLAGLLLFDLLAMRFGVDSRVLGVRDERGQQLDLANGDEWHDALRAHPVRIRLAEALRGLAVRIDPAAAPVRRTPAGGWQRMA